MDHTLRRAFAAVLFGAVATVWTAGCSSDTTASGPGPDAATGGDAKSEASADTGAATSDGRAPSDGGGGEAASYTYVLIDDMETTTHGPIELAGIDPPLSPGYWFNFGASACGDTATPPLTEFTFTALPTPTTTYKGKASMHAAHQQCGLNGKYDVCGIGLEFAQVTDYDAAAPITAAPMMCPDASPGDAAGEAGSPSDAASASDVASAHDAAPTDATAAGDAVASSGSPGQDAGDGGDAGPPIPKVTVPFDISQYKGITFWAKAAVTGDAGALSLKVQFPDTDTDPRGGVCNSALAGAAGPTDPTECYNNYAIQMEMVADTWQQFTVLYKDLVISPDYGYQTPGPWDGKKVYGIQWQAQRNDDVNGIAEIQDFWIDDVYFIE
jgi:hypothetical protein